MEQEAVGGQDQLSTVPSVLARHRATVQAAADCLAWVAGLAFAVTLRFDFKVTDVDWSGYAGMALVVVAIQVLVGLAYGIYSGRWQYGAFEELVALVGTTALTTAALAAVTVAFDRPVPLSAAASGGVTALTLMAGARVAWRTKLDRRRRPQEATSRLLVFGAGEAAETLLTSLLRTPDSSYLPVALLDDDPAKRRLRIKGVPVVGTSASICSAAKSFDAHALLIAIPSADAELVRRITEQADECGLEIKVLPTVGELMGDRIGASDIRPLTMADLLGRREIDTDVRSIAGYLTGRRVLVTGAGGSIGSELCRQITRFGPAELIMLDRDESALHAVQLSIDGRALLDSPSLVLADLREPDRIHDLMREHRPEVVFHAAALKHLTLLERHPEEALKTNVLGTLTMLRAAEAAGVERFVNISTDKAADPTSVLGTSKRVAERLTAHAAARNDGVYLSVRFGNVLGSRGSVLSTFREQVRSGGPVTVTHPEVTRFFMTVEEAVQLTIQAGAIGKDGEVLVLDMGTPVRINEVAERLVAHAERHVEIVYTGLRPGEKLHEALFSDHEVGVQREHPLISHVDVVPLEPGCVQDLPSSDAPALARHLGSLCKADRRGPRDAPQRVVSDN